jgi:hypothetical protein
VGAKPSTPPSTIEAETELPGAVALSKHEYSTPVRVWAGTRIEEIDLEAVLVVASGLGTRSEWIRV